ncbi:unnamed protein product [Effrenium voratum]|nr:unnamed protein product [Effrenium voratum]
MVAEGNLYERIHCVRADARILWMTELPSALEHNGKASSLSAGASEFVPGGGGTFTGLSPKATEYVPAQHEGAGQWGWNGSQWTPEMNSLREGNQDWGLFNGYAGQTHWQSQGVSAASCWFNDDAYSDSSRSSSESDENDNEAAGDAAQSSDAPADPKPPADSKPDEALQMLSADEDDDDDFNSFSEDEMDAPASAREAGPSQGDCADEVAADDSGDAQEVRSEDSSCYNLNLMLSIRRAVAAAESAGRFSEKLPRWSTQAVSEEMPDWLRRRGNEPESKEENGKEWRARNGGEAKPRRKNTQDAKGKPDRAPEASEMRAAVKLEVSETSWAAQMARRKELNKESSDDAFVKSMRSILNKLTVEKFDTLSEQIIDLIAASDRPNHGIPLLMQLVFEKATTQHHFINMYVGLCVKLHQWLTDNSKIDVAESQSNFKRVLLNQCQTSFEQYLEPPEGFDGFTGDDLFEAQVKYKTKMLGNIRLVGELIRHGMLAPKIAIAVATELARDDPAVRAERLETLATFLETVGVALDDPSWKHHGELEMVFTEVIRASADKSVSRRVRCLLQDVLDLRKEGWRSNRRKDLSKETPQTLAQVHEQAKTQQTPSSKKEIFRSLSSRSEVPSPSCRTAFNLQSPSLNAGRQNNSLTAQSRR